ncbi:MAG: MGMT family protein [Myxococcaceae bacterium]|nr:MGMT family protein [Myxococcaceae bacterium]
MGHARVDAKNLSAFERAVKRVVAQIPKGTVLAYGEVALLAGRPGGARAVVRALNRLSGLPWWRVVRADGTLAPEVVRRQAPKLRAEGVRVDGRRIVRRGGGAKARRP